MWSICTGTGFSYAASARSAALPSSARWEKLRESDLRVTTVTYRLALANRQFCGAAIVPLSGIALHSIEQYGTADRKDALQRFRFGPYVGVMAVVVGSPAARAGLSADDQLVAINGRALRSPSSDEATPTNAPVEAARQALLAEMQKGEVTLLVTGAAGTRTVRFTAEKGCRSAVELVPGEVVNASADGERIIVSSGLLDRCTSDEDLALVIGHELAHNLLHHAARLARGGNTITGLLPKAGPGLAEIRATEEEADRLGVRLAMTAGYDLSGAASFLHDLQTQAGADRSASTHPGPEQRLALLSAAIARRSGHARAFPHARSSSERASIRSVPS
jgi:hypothetical protein